MQIDFAKGDGLVPAIVQDNDTNQVLMLGYMNAEALEKTKESGLVTFYSRSQKKLWTKGETSANFLQFHSILVDCDNDTLLIKATPAGPVCHTGAQTCFKEEKPTGTAFLNALEKVIEQRKNNPSEKSYTTFLLNKGLNKVAQKVGEEAVEVVIEALAGKEELLKEESADLLYHLLVLLAAKGISLNDVIDVLAKRHK